MILKQKLQGIQKNISQEEKKLKEELTSRLETFEVKQTKKN